MYYVHYQMDGQSRVSTFTTALAAWSFLAHVVVDPGCQAWLEYVKRPEEVPV